MCLAATHIKEERGWIKHVFVMVIAGYVRGGVDSEDGRTFWKQVWGTPGGNPWESWGKSGFGPAPDVPIHLHLLESQSVVLSEQRHSTATRSLRGKN